MFALIQHERYFANAVILSVGTESLMLDAHEVCVNHPATPGTFYSVRPVDHEMTAAAAAQMAERLSVKQRLALGGIAAINRRWVEPGSRTPSRAVRVPGFSHPTDVIAPARRLETLGMLNIAGQPYAPKKYGVTPIGRIVGNAINAEAVKA